MEPTLVVANGTIVTEHETHPGDVVIAGEQIVGIVAPGAAPEAETTIDATGLHVFPGFVDGHVHFREPGFTHKGDFTTESRAAVYGGITTVVDGPNTGNVVRFAEDVLEKQQIGEAKSYVDFGQMAALTDENMDRIPELVEVGVVAVKIFMGYKYALSGLQLSPPPDGPLVEALRNVAATGIRLSVHAENGDVITYLREKFRAEGRNHPFDHLASRPAYGEADAIATIIRFCEEAGGRLEIRHLSCKEGLPIVQAAKDRGVDIVLETCPHYLVFDADELEKLGPVGIINPPIRFADHAEALREGIRGGIIDTIGTDHGPSGPEEKFRDNLWDVAPGFDAIETALPTLLTLAQEGEWTLNDVVRLYAANTAKAWDLYPRKGSLLPGADADVTICELGTRRRIDQEQLHGKHNISPFHGREVTASVHYVMLRGQLMVREGELIAPGPRGKMVRPWFKGAYRFDCVHGPRRAHDGVPAFAEAARADASDLKADVHEVDCRRGEATGGMSG